MRIPLLSGCLSRQAAFTRIASLFMPMVAAVVFFGVAAQSAYAHWPIVTAATPTCSDGKIVISFTITSWDVGSTQRSGSLGPMDGEDNNVEVFFGGPNPVASGAFVDPTDSFSGQADAPLGVTQVTVSALAVSTWGDGYQGGEDSNDFGTSMTVTLPTNCGPTGIGRFTGGGKIVVSNAIVPASGEVTVTNGFEVECDRDPQHENLELNWTGGNHFHMNKITSASCTLTGLPPNPPTAQVNKIEATGTGSFNGMDGYTVVFTLWDQGEPGTNDEAGFIVCKTDPAHPNSCSTSTSIVLSVPVQTITTGNIQAHLDQGH